MSILGYSAAYFLPQYWVNTPLYGEKIIPLLDYILSTDYQYTDKLASAFYDIESKYKNTADLPMDKIEAIIEESGYSYIRNLLGQDEDSIRLLVYILVLIHELKGSKKGVETVLRLLKTKDDDMQLVVAGSPNINDKKEVTGFSEANYVSFSNFSVGDKPFELVFQIRTSSTFENDQCIASASNYGFYIGIDSDGKIILKVGETVNGNNVWQVLNGSVVNKSSKPLLQDTEYYIKLYFSGNTYGVSVSKDGTTYTNYIDIESTQGLGVEGGIIYLGVDGSGPEKKEPFQGIITLGTFNVSASSVVVTQWYETFPVGEEDTFSVDADVDVSLVSSDFFVKFAKFVERYVYPSLDAFRARMALKAKLTFLPYVRQKMDYIACNILDAPKGYELYNVKTDTDREVFDVRAPKLYAWTRDGEYVYTLSEVVYPASKLYNKDMSSYTGSNFSIGEISTTEYRVLYKKSIVADRDDNYDVYTGIPFFVEED